MLNGFSPSTTRARAQHFSRCCLFVSAVCCTVACGAKQPSAQLDPVARAGMAAPSPLAGAAGLTTSAGASEKPDGGTAGSAAGQAGNASASSAGHAGHAGAGGAAGGGVAGSAGALAGNMAPAAGAGGSLMPAAGSGGAMGCQPPMPGSHGKNPLFTDQYTADPGALVHDCTFYIQCGHDEGQTGFVMKEWFLLSSTDMVHWTKNVALKLTDFKWADANAWAGQMVTKGGKFYWYVPVEERGGGMALAIAVADSPTGPFKDALGKPLVNDAFEMSNMGFRMPSDTPYTIDPTVFVDDDGHAYLHYGGFGRMIVAKLSDDMLSIDGKMQEVTPKGFFEAAFLTKREGKYYEIYAAGQNPATIDYATSTSPLGPWKYGGRVLDALPSLSGQDAATNHSGVAEFSGTSCTTSATAPTAVARTSARWPSTSSTSPPTAPFRKSLRVRA
jgi:hypothetical protein